MSAFMFKPQDPIPASTTLDRLGIWYADLNRELFILLKGRGKKNLSCITRDRMEYMIHRRAHDIKKVVDAACEKPLHAYDPFFYGFKTQPS